MLDKAKFAASFAGDVAPERAMFLANAQVPWGVDALAGEITAAAWRNKPSWYLVTKDDKMIPPEAQRAIVQTQRRHRRRDGRQPRHLRVRGLQRWPH